MDPFCKRILLEVTESEKLIYLFEVCGVIKMNDIMEVDDDILNKMEKFIFNFLSRETNVEQHLDTLTVYNSSKFVFAPGMRLKILRAVKKIQDENQLLHLSSNLNNSIKTEFSHKCNNEINETHLKLEPLCHQNNPVEFNELELYSQTRSNYNEIIRKKKEILNVWGQNVIERVSKKFPDIKLEYNIDFDLDINIQKTELGPKCSGLFLCHFCRKIKGQTRSIKFSVSKENYVILSNVITHLKLHFSHQKNSIIPV